MRNRLKNALSFSGRQYREDTSRKISWGHWFAFFNIIIAMLIGSRYAFLIDWPDTLFGKIYFFISLLGHFSFSVFAVYLLIIFPLSFVVKNHRTFRGLTVILYTVAVTLLLFDTQVFARFNFHLSSLVWNLLVTPENGELSRDWQIFFAPMPLILLMQMLFSRWSWEKLRSLERQKWLKKVGVVLTLSFIANHLIYAWADAFLYRPITMQRSNFPLSYPMTARSFLEKHGVINREEYARTLEREGRLDALKIDYPKNPLRFEPITRRPNILLITVSGLRHDAVTPQNMPQLAQFAARSTLFTNHYSSGNTHRTGLVGLFYGLNANYTDSILAAHTPSVLIQKLQAEHYRFGLFSATRFKDSLFRQSLFKGFNLPKSDKGNESAVKNLTVFWQNQPNDTAKFGYADLALTAANPDQYARQTAQLDQLLGELLAQLQLDDTLVVITATHGMSFDGHNANAAQNRFAADLTNVPLIVHWQGLPTAPQTGLSSHTDLLPALMSGIFNAQNPVSDYAQGSNLFNLKGNDWVLVSNFHWYAIIEPDGTQYQIDRHGNYRKFDVDYRPMSSNRPPLGLFLDVFNPARSFFDK